MDNEPAKTHQEMRRGRLNKVLLIVIIAIAIVLLASGAYYYQSKIAAKHVLGASQAEPEHTMGPHEKTQTPIPLTNRQKKELANGTSTATKKKLFEVTGGNYYFTPSTITVNQGDKVTIMFLNLFGMHDFVIESLHVRIPPLRPGLPGVATFTADKKGTYEFTSSFPQDRQMGMKGTLTVR
jgi:plastocyanin